MARLIGDMDVRRLAEDRLGFLPLGRSAPGGPLSAWGGGRAVKAAQPMLLELTNNATDGGIHSIWGRFLVLFVSSFSAQSLDTLL